MIGALHQFVPALEAGAVGAHTLEVQRLIRDMGLTSEIYADFVGVGFEHLALEYGNFASAGQERRDSALLYQMAIGSWVGVYVAARPEPLLVTYHNISPPRDFAMWDHTVEYGLSWGRRQLTELASRAIVGLAPSEFSRCELAAVGFRDSRVAPLLVDLDALAAAADAQVLHDLRARKAKGGADLLFVGRIAPHKAQHDLVVALAAFRRLYDPLARLCLVGGPVEGPYADAVRQLIADLGLASSVHLAGPIDDAALAAHYQAADVYVSLSEHEGFGVPLLEAMRHGLPIVAFGAAAVPETVGDAAIVLTDKRPATVAAAVWRACSDSTLRAGLVAVGAERVKSFGLKPSRAQLRRILETVLGKL